MSPTRRRTSVGPSAQGLEKLEQGRLVQGQSAAFLFVNREPWREHAEHPRGGPSPTGATPTGSGLRRAIPRSGTPPASPAPSQGLLDECIQPGELGCLGCPEVSLNDGLPQPQQLVADGLLGVRLAHAPGDLTQHEGDPRQDVRRGGGVAARLGQRARSPKISSARSPSGSRPRRALAESAPPHRTSPTGCGS